MEETNVQFILQTLMDINLNFIQVPWMTGYLITEVKNTICNFLIESL